MHRFAAATAIANGFLVGAHALLATFDGRTRQTPQLEVERIETVGVEALPDPLDRVFPDTAYRAARYAEGRPRLRRMLGSDRLVVARRR